jgi:hypothetical protein
VESDRRSHKHPILRSPAGLIDKPGPQRDESVDRVGRLLCSTVGWSLLCALWGWHSGLGSAGEDRERQGSWP